MASKMPKKSFDGIKMKELFEILDLLQIDYDEEDFDLKKLREKAKEEVRQHSLNQMMEFSAITKAKEEDMVKRRKLREIYTEVELSLENMDDNVISVLNKYHQNRDTLKLIEEQKDRLNKTDYYYILIAGESSAGKSSLLNLILGEELLPHHVLNSTSTICELKYGVKRKLVVHQKRNGDKEANIRPKSLLLEAEEECGKSYQDQIAPYVQQQQGDRENGSCYEKVEIFWPHVLLEKGIVIVDSPGLGESDDMDEVLMKYLPNAFAFIYVIDVSHAGGVQRDLKQKIIEILEKVQSLGGYEKRVNLADCSLFVCNKWDQVKKNEKDKVKKYLVTKLSECWEDPNLNNKIVYISILNAIKAQEYGGITNDFKILLENVKQMIIRAINTRLFNHWEFLDLMLYLIFNLTFFFTREVQSTHHKTREQLENICSRLKNIEDEKEEICKLMENRLKEKTEFLFSKLNEYIRSSEFREDFCSWSDSSLPQNGNTWDKTKFNVMKAIEYRFKTFLTRWESDKQICSEIHRQLVDEFFRRLNLLEEELQKVERVMYIVEKEIAIDYSSKESTLPNPAKVFAGITSPLWIPVGVVGLLIGMPVLGAISMTNKVTGRMKLEQYRKNRHSYLEKRAKKFLDSLEQEDVRKYAECLMEKITKTMRKYADLIPAVIEADRKMVSQLLNETRSHDEVLKLYSPIRNKSCQVRKSMTPLGIELCSETIDARDLEWKETTNTCLGDGEFSRVYRGTMKNGGKIATLHPDLFVDVAVKVFKKALDYSNFRFFLREEIMIRYLDHQNVVNFFGAVKRTPQHNENTFVFVSAFCDASLRSVIANDKSKVPAKATSNISTAINMFLKWAIEIADGLNYIHEKGLVHRHLKLDNIMINKDGGALISDIGIVGQFQKTGKSLIYLAPEVLKEPRERSKEGDIYSYGIMLWEMWYGDQAFTEMEPIDANTFRECISKGHRPGRKDMTISLLRVEDMMTKCWAGFRAERPLAKDCLQSLRNISHQYNTEHGTKSLEMKYTM